MGNSKAGGYVSKLIFNTGKELNVSANDIVIFVGPNNAGKSQSLKDIFKLSKNCNISSVVVSNIEIEKYNNDIESLLSTLSKGVDNGTHISYSVLGNNMIIYKGINNIDEFQREKGFEGYRDLFVANLDTAARLSICFPPQNIQRDSPKEHPIQFAAFDRNYRKWLSKCFKKAFNEEVIPNNQFGSTIPLCIGEPVRLEGEYEDEQERLEEYANIIASYEQVQNQGDGIKSFIGILLYLMLDYFCTFLIDEPESFLHPPQAKLMGQIIGKKLTDNQQAFISTHSEEIIKGLMEVCPERIKIVRITREKNTNEISILRNEEFIHLWNDPLLKYSNIMTSLFYSKVVICESDSDCKMYSTIDRYIKQKKNKYSETLFIHCGGKYRMEKIVKALRSLDLDVKIIVDMDILNDEKVFRGIVESYNIDYELIRPKYNSIISNLHSSKENVSREDAYNKINKILKESNDDFLSKSEIKEIKNVVSSISNWHLIKKVGEAAIPSGDAMNAYNYINKILIDHGIFLVPVGELENFIKEVGGHGPEWVSGVLEKYSDLEDEVYNNITDFVSSLNL